MGDLHCSRLWDCLALCSKAGSALTPQTANIMAGRVDTGAQGEDMDCSAKECGERVTTEKIAYEEAAMRGAQIPGKNYATAEREAKEEEGEKEKLDEREDTLRACVRLHGQRARALRAGSWQQASDAEARLVHLLKEVKSSESKLG